MSPLDVLLAENACRAQVLAAAAAVDGQDYAGLVRLFTPNATLARPDGVQLVGRQAIFDAYAARDPDRLTRHLVCNLAVSVQGEGRAVASCRILLWSGRRSDPHTPRGRPADGKQQVGEIDDWLVQADGQWLIERREARFSLWRDAGAA